MAEDAPPQAYEDRCGGRNLTDTSIIGRHQQVNSKAMPGLLDIAMFWRDLSEHAVLAKPPTWVQNALFGLLAPIARLSRRRAPTCARTHRD